MGRRILCKRLFVHAGIPGHRAVMESVQVDALPIHVGKVIVSIGRAVDIPRSIQSHTNPVILHVNPLRGEADPAAPVPGYLDFCRMADLDGVSSNGGYRIALDHSVFLPGGASPGM